MRVLQWRMTPSACSPQKKKKRCLLRASRLRVKSFSKAFAFICFVPKAFIKYMGIALSLRTARDLDIIAIFFPTYFFYLLHHCFTNADSPSRFQYTHGRNAE